ncbi:MotA/TolQ/ExbB proton channel family protein [Carboxylicivirga taeanensis]|uniref:MotA/TolQ/ExbB proton channel family protein n=1 Tax=Carboxylicivirga taeanensis TaxID=1416875 RepID=UPI003F6DC471
MKSLFYQGGPLFMGILTLLLIIQSVWMIYHFIIFIKSKNAKVEKALRHMSYGRSIGLLTLIIGLLGQMVGLHNAFDVLETTVVSPQVLTAGIKVTMIPTLYGMLIYIYSLILWFGFSQIIETQADKH